MEPNNLPSSNPEPKKKTTVVAITVIVVLVLAVVGIGALLYFYRQAPSTQTNSDSVSVSIPTEDAQFYSETDVFGCGRYLHGGGPGYDFGTEFVIRSQADYEKLQSDATSAFNCEWGAPAPAIDFDQKTLLGKYASGGGCTIDFDRSATRDDGNKKVVYTVNVVGKGGCEMLGTSMNWVTIPKIPDDYEVVFSVPSEPKEPDPAPSNVIESANDLVVQRVGQTFFEKYISLQSSREVNEGSEPKQYFMNYKFVISDNPIEAYLTFNIDANGKLVSEADFPFPDCKADANECEFIKQAEIIDITKNAAFDGKGFGGNAIFVWDKDFKTFAWNTSIGAPDNMRGCNQVQEMAYVIDANDGKILSTKQNIQTDCSSANEPGVSTNSVSADPVTVPGN